MRNIPKRRKNETLDQWTERAMMRDLDNGRVIDAMWMADLTRNIKAERAARLAAIADKVYAASEPTGKPILDALINASESFADLEKAEQQQTQKENTQ